MLLWATQCHVFRTWWFEPLLSSIAFTVFIHVYWFLERLDGTTRSQIPPIVSAFSKKVGSLRQAAAGYWIGIVLWVHVIPPAATHIADGLPTATWSLYDYCYLIAEVVSGIVLYDAIFFLVHWALHEVTFLQPFHRYHHYHHHHHSHGHAGVVEAQDVLQHSLLDGSLQVLVNILVQRHTVWGSVKTRFARALHNILVIWMLTESHTSSSHRFWARWLPGIRYHRWHHGSTGGEETSEQQRLRRRRHYHRYQQFFSYLDDWREQCSQ